MSNQKHTPRKFQLQNLIENIWYPRAGSFGGAKILILFLYPFSLIYRVLGFLRSLFTKSQTINCKTIVVGNITAGGSGKTPFIIALAQELINQNISFGVIAHGYRAQTQIPTEVLIDDNISDKIKLYGDEALLIKNIINKNPKNINVPVFIGRPRLLTAQKMLEKYPHLQLIIFDDGLQDPSFKRDLEIVLFSQESLGNKLIIPAGPMREEINTLYNPSKYARERMVVATDKHTTEDNIKQQIIGGVLLQDFVTNKNINFQSLMFYKNYHWLFFAAFARPWRLSQAISKIGLSLYEFFYPDHFPLNLSEIKTRLQNVPAEISKKAVIVLSEKDAVKLIYSSDFIKLDEIKIPIVVVNYSLLLNPQLIKKILIKIK